MHVEEMVLWSGESTSLWIGRLAFRSNYLGILQAGYSIIGSLKLAIMGYIGPRLLTNMRRQGFFFFLLKVTLPTHHAYILVGLQTGCWVGLLVYYEVALKHDFLICRIIIILVFVIGSMVSGKYFITFCPLYMTV